MTPIRLALAALLIGTLVCAARPIAAQDATGVSETAPDSFVINLRDADIRVLSEQVSQITGRTLVLDPTISGTVTVISTQPLNPDGVWELYQSVLGVQGFAALPSGTLWRIVPQATIREGGAVLESTADPGKLDVITRLVPLKNFPAATAAGALRPLVASFGYIEAVADTNTLVITDTAENVRRIESIALALDSGDVNQTYTIPILNADAQEIGAALQGVLGVTEGGTGPRVTVDPRSNTILLTADADTFATVGRIVADLDVPGRSAPSVVPVTRVYRLNYADATSLAGVLQGLVGGGAAQATNPVALALADTPDGVVDLRQASPALQQDTNVTIQPVIETNAVVVRAREEVQADIAALIQNLDQRRPQVLIEAAIVEVSGDISEALGVQLGFGTATPPGGFAATSFSPAGVTLDNILRILNVPAAAAINPSGLSIGLSRKDNFGILLQALGQSTKANLLSTPSITTLDNQPAEIIVGQNVPFRTGSFSTDGNTTTPFTTIERKDVGITMRVVPRVNQGDVVQLEVSQEVSSLVNANIDGAADLITNRRSIKTTVLADNGGTIVLGGLITDDRQSIRSEVPGLGRVPILGELFKSRSEQRRKQTLFVFLRPTILRTRADVATVSGESFQRLKAIEIDPAASRSLLAEPKPVRRLPVEIDGLY